MRGVERDDEHAGKLTIGAPKWSRELDGPFAGGATNDWLADEQLVLLRLLMDAEVFPIAKIDRSAWIKQGRAGDHDTRRVDDGDLHGLFVGRVFILDKGLPFVSEAAALVAAPHE